MDPCSELPAEILKRVNRRSDYPLDSLPQLFNSVYYTFNDDFALREEENFKHWFKIVNKGGFIGG